MLAEPRKRHNGQPQACEPCRKAKIRCDHASPKCSRCLLRSLDCIYHPAPMTKRRPPASHTPTHFDTTLPVDLLTTQNVSSTFQVPTASSVGTGISLPPADPSPAASSGLTARSSASKRNMLFHEELGQHETTRFSAVFVENQNSFDAVMLDATNSNHHELGREPDVTARSRVELAVRTLLNFPTARTFDMLMTEIHHIYDIWLSPTMIQQCLKQVWTEYPSQLGQLRTRESVLRVANDLFLNHKRPRSIPDCDDTSNPDHASWMNWFGGPNLRWEMIGILFSWAGIAFRCKQEWDPVFNLPEQHGRNRNTAADRMRECAAACIRLCEGHFEISDIMVICMKNSTRLQSILISDESDRLRVDYGTVRSAFISAGLHRVTPAKEVTPFSQHRASLASSMYYYDKSHSLFNARPPMLSNRYCQSPLPLDLCENDVYGGRERLTAAIAKLDSNGWNTNGHIFTTTWLRALAMLSPIREGILELTLSVNSTFTKSQVEHLKVQLEKIVASYPPHIQYRGNSEWHLQSASQSHERSAHEVYITTRIHLDVLQCQFLLQRLLVSRQFSGGQDLFDIAQETMSVILSLWLNRDQLQELHHAFDWIAVSYGMPCAGILCVQLLRASNLVPPAPQSDLPSTSAHDYVRFSRSEVVQNLIMFKALLDWIRPTDNNVQLSKKFKAVLQRIIDAMFDSLESRDMQTQEMLGEQQSQRHYGPQDQLSPGQNLPAMGRQHDIDPEINTFNDMDWLNTVDWTQGGWLELSNLNGSTFPTPHHYLKSTNQSLARQLAKSPRGQTAAINLTSLTMSPSGSFNTPRQPVEDATMPFWLRDIHELHDHRSTEELPVSSDIVIIGAGYAGVSTAYHLVKGEASDKKLSITILEARGVCSGATGRNGGHLRPDMYTPMTRAIDRGGTERALEVIEFEIAHIQAIKSLVEKEKIDCDFTLTRSIDVWSNEEAARKAKKLYDTLVSRDLEYMKDVFFVLGKDAEGISGVKGAKACASFTAGTLWPYKFILHLTASILKTGRVNLQAHTPATSVRRQPSGSFIIATTRGTTVARKVVYANNAYVSGLLPQYREAIVPCKGLCTHISVPEGTRAPLLNNSYIIREEDNVVSYLIPRADGSIVVGGANSRYHPVLSSWYDSVDDSTLIEEVKDHYDGYMQRFFNGWEDSGAEVDKVWTGIMGYSWDSQPHVGSIPGEDNQYVIAGFNGHGMPLAFLSALGVAKMVNGIEFEDAGIPRLFQSTKERLDKVRDGPLGGDIIGVKR
ncbi:FAD dependent oxidoreductase superfamily [Penicillium concentricum]|uniref:FAD dependent oxidoreductase superfamily n=1 Tax=Penicillium concentricum TaxID=293559 RepID=A0A9W9V946_9EURO|nr:FAD dependent oxidoreductase superfamily [Penicillium concentricum]KAJ5373478.1 FAD dependent oxidoreductase superfamily [Penicillium concentricum]